MREPRAVEATETNRSSAAPHARDSDEDTAITPAPVITVPWNAPAFVSVKGVLHQPSGKAMLKPETRDAILLAIVKARTWIDDLVSGRVQSFAEIAQHEGKVERHVRLLAPLAFTPPGMLAYDPAGTINAPSMPACRRSISCTSSRYHKGRYHFARFSSPKTRPLPANPRGCRRFSHTWKSHRRDRTGWLTTQS